MPLTDDEKRVILSQLLSLRDLQIITLPQYESEVAKLKLTVADEQQARKDAVTAEQLATKAAQVERDSYKSQMEFYQSALKAVTKKPSKWCLFARILTLGIKACH